MKQCGQSVATPELGTTPAEIGHRARLTKDKRLSGIAQNQYTNTASGTAEVCDGMVEI